LRGASLGLGWAIACIAAVACSRAKDASRDAGTPPTGVEVDDDAFVWPLASAETAPAVPPRKGMVFIPAGTLVAGTAKDKIPRLADQELAAEPISMHGFYVDEYAFPNEAGAIPKTGLNRDEAAVLCSMQGKRLCTELEWERACKGPSNTTYEYGEQYRPAECATGGATRLTPSALRVMCKSGFGIHDLHGGPWEWTSSSWQRGGDAAAGVLRGGNAEAGELVSRCANAMPLTPRLRRTDVGARCCAGDPNDAEVKLVVGRGKPLEAHTPDGDLRAAFGAAIRDKAQLDLPADLPFHVDRLFTWRPAGNEAFLLAAGCAKRTPHSTCGVGVFPGDDGGGGDRPMIAFALSGFWNAVVRQDHRGRDIWVYGGDEKTTYRRRVAYVWGKIAVGDTERNGRRAAGSE
jgi:sulfatase modifying factor 1